MGRRLLSPGAGANRLDRHGSHLFLLAELDQCFGIPAITGIGVLDKVEGKQDAVKIESPQGLDKNGGSIYPMTGDTHKTG